MSENPKPVYKTMEELKAAAREKFSDEEIEKFINMGKAIACKPVLTMLKETIEEYTSDGSRDNDITTAKKLARKVMRLCPYTSCAHLEMDFADVPYHFGLSLSMMPKDYIAAIDIPEAYVRDVIQQYISLKATACAFWTTFCNENQALVAKIANYCTNVDFSQLTIDPDNKTQMYFTTTTSNRICICPYYFDDDRKIIFKQPQEFIAAIRAKQAKKEEARRNS